MIKYRMNTIGFLGFLLACTGCSGWLRGDLGAMSSTTLNSGRQGGVGSLDASLGDRDFPVSFDVGLRAKGSKSVGDGALFLGGLLLQTPEPVGLYVLGGTNFLQLGSADGKISFGMFSPSAELGMLIGTHPVSRNGVPDKLPGRFLLGAGVQYDLRFTQQPNEGFFMVKLGYALVAGPK